MWGLGLLRLVGAGAGGWGGGVFDSDEGHVLTGAGPFFISKSKQAACWGLGVMGKEETVMLIGAAHTSPSNNKTKQRVETRKKQQTTAAERPTQQPRAYI